jgi:hypothetical protein
MKELPDRFYGQSVFLLILFIVIVGFVTLIILGVNGQFSSHSTSTTNLEVSQAMLDVQQLSNNALLTQTFSGIITLCLSSNLPTGKKAFRIKTNSFGIFFINNTDIQYTGPIYFQPNQTYHFSIYPAPRGSSWILTCFSPPIDITVSPTLYWMNYVATNMIFPPPQASRKLAEMSLVMYQSVVQFPNFILQAVINEAARIWCNSQLPTLSTDVVYNSFPVLSIADQKEVSNYIFSQLMPSLAYPAAAESTVYTVPPTAAVAPFFWTGTDPILPNWNLVPYLANTYTTIPGISTATIPDDAKALEIVVANRTEPQTQIGLYFKGYPPTHLTQMYITFLASEKFPEKSLVQIMSLLQIAMADAGVYAWTTKFKYWIIRPFQYIPSLTPLFTTPNFPGFISGHSTFAAAIGTMFGLLIPKYSAISKHIAEAAANSREYSGIHFHTDDQVGLISGTQIGASVKQALLTQTQNYTNFI